MLRSGLASSRVFSPSHEESGDEDWSVLPRHTKVIVTGNNRTKGMLVGLRGVVKNAVGHGGWHWLVLDTGDEVKLQRNALTVLEPPTGDEEDDYGMDYFCSGSDVQEKASRQLSSNAQYGKQNSSTIKHTKPHTPASSKSSKSSKSGKSASLSSLMGFQSIKQAPQLNLDFSSLSTKSLLKYWRRFNLGICTPNTSRNQLIYAMKKHFLSKTMDEEKTIVEFIRSAKRLKSEGGGA